jgi:hypothetical protein
MTTSFHTFSNSLFPLTQKIKTLVEEEEDMNHSATD